MKKVMNKINFAIICLMTAGPAFAAGEKTLNTSAFCQLFAKLHDIFNLLRIAAFIGAAFYIAGWAWEFISKPGDMKVDKIKEKGTGLLVGFILLFMVGIILSFVLSATGMKLVGCDANTLITSW